MAVKAPTLLQKVIYGAFFVVVLPALLMAWAHATKGLVPLPVPQVQTLGLILSSLGTLAMFAGMAALWTHGRGLPMNLAPPPQLVTQGIYGILPHPIYTGFCLLCVGVSLLFESPSGLWLVTPVVILGCAALVLGYERHDLRERFGEASVRPLLPADEPRKPTLQEIAACYLCVLIPWFFLYEAVIVLGMPPDAVSAYLPFEARLPVWEWTEVFYASCYIFTALAPLAAGSARVLRRFAVRGLLAMAVCFAIYLVVPLVAVPRAFEPRGVLGHLLAWERALDAPVAAFPPFHVVWALLAAEAFAERWPAGKWLWRGWAWGIAASCITTGQHALVDVLAGIVVVVLAARAWAIWAFVRTAAEGVANSWKDWRFGPLRVMNHGAYAALAGAVGMLVAMPAAGRGNTTAVLLSATLGIISAGLWAQFTEGSPALLRPFGYYGALVGTSLGVTVAGIAGADGWLLLAAFALCAPWVQGIGRLRCLVQGCCHGRPAPERAGIRHWHPMSRVCRLSAWRDVPLHPTPVYSLVWNAALAAALGRLWSLHAATHLVAGLYFILSGLGRFVEEAYRGEPQTPVFARLRIYQWLAVTSVVAGAMVTAVGRGAPAPEFQFEVAYILPALAFGGITWFAYGMDFPDVNRRFARLA